MILTRLYVASLLVFTLPMSTAASAADRKPPGLRFSPEPESRSILLDGDRAHFSFVGGAVVNAVISHYDDIVVRLLSDPSRRQSEGGDALLAAIQLSDPHMVSLILATGVDPNDVHGGGAGALAYAVSRGDNRVICMLADYHVALVSGSAPHLPLLTALTSGSLDAAQLLMSLGYVPSDIERTRLHDIGVKRAQWLLWQAILAMPADDTRAVDLCRRMNAVAPMSNRLQ